MAHPAEPQPLLCVQRYAEAFFPRLDSQAGVTLSLVDVWGDQHHAQYTYWSCNHRDESGQKRMFVMAASTLLAAYGLEVRASEEQAHV